jgi:hypothetical protein
MERSVVKSLALTLVFVAGCYGPSYSDCTIACSAETGCPSGFSCSMSENLCRTGETTDSCTTVMDDGGGSSCFTFYGDSASYAAATTSIAMNTEDFTRLADGSPTPQTFVVQDGDTFFWHDRVTFESVGVNSDAGTQANTIAVAGAGSAIPPYSIMSQIDETARDAITAPFSAPEAAVALALQDDDGSQAFSLEVTTRNGTQTFPVPSGHTPFAGVVSTCVNTITSITLSPPTPSGWWRLFSASFGP